MGTDLVRRAHLIAAFDAPHKKGYAASIVESLLFWSVVLCAGSRRRGLRAGSAWLMPGVFLALFTLAMGVEGAFHGFYNIYLSMDGQIHSKSIPWSILGTLPFSRPIVLAHMLAALALGAGLVHLGRRYLRTSRWPFRLTTLLVPAVLYAVGTIPVSYRTLQSTPFDMIYFQGLGALVRETLGYTHDSPDLRVQRRAV